MSPNEPFTPRSLVGMTQGARKRKVWAAYQTGISESWSRLCAAYRIGQKLRPCSGCDKCGGVKLVNGMRLDMYLVICDGSGVLPARKENQ